MPEGEEAQSLLEASLGNGRHSGMSGRGRLRRLWRRLESLTSLSIVRRRRGIGRAGGLTVPANLGGAPPAPSASSRTSHPSWLSHRTSWWTQWTDSRGPHFYHGKRKGCLLAELRGGKCIRCSTTSSSSTRGSCAGGGRRLRRAANFSRTRRRARSGRRGFAASAQNSRRANSLAARPRRMKWCAWCSRSRRRFSPCPPLFPARRRTCRRPTSAKSSRDT